MTSAPAPLARQTPAVQRAEELDALRGIAILAMILSGTIPFQGIMPAWMYHAQVPPPNHQFNPDLPGLTWVDLVFPLFIFALGAAIPLAQSRRLTRGWTNLQVVLSIVKRGFLLAAFAIASQHFRPVVISSEPVAYKWQFGLIGFAVLFCMFVQLPKSYPKWLRVLVPIGGWTAGMIFLSRLQYPHHEQYKTFSLYRSDIILLVLANIAVFASLIWLFTRTKPGLRLGILACLFPLQLSASDGGWITQFLSSNPVPWLFNFGYLKYLFIAIPATLIGDYLVTWLDSDRQPEDPTRTGWRYLAIALLSLAIDLTLLIGLQARWLEVTALASLALCFCLYLLSRNPKTETAKPIQHLSLWGFYWLTLGLAFEPYEGGIKKDPATMSYFFVCLAMSIFLFIFLAIALRIFKQRRWLQLFIDNGRNPMIAYVAFGNLLWPVIELAGWQESIEEMTKTPWMGLAIGLIYTLTIAIFVSFCTRLKLFWKT